MSKFFHRLDTLLFLLAGIAVLAATILLAVEARDRARTGWVVDRVRIAPTDTVVALGAHQLGLAAPPRGSATPLLLLRRDADGWLLADGNPARPIQIVTGERRFDLALMPLETGALIRLDDRTITVLAAGAGGLTIADDRGRTVTWRDRLAHAGGERPYCDAATAAHAFSAAGRLRQWLRQVTGGLRKMLAPLVVARDSGLRLAFSIGGQTDCAMRWAMPGLPIDSALVHTDGDLFWLRIDAAEPTWHRLAAFGDEPRLRIGRTVYGIKRQPSGNLVLTGLTRRDLLPEIGDQWSGGGIDLTFLARDWIGHGDRLAAAAGAMWPQWLAVAGIPLVIAAAAGAIRQRRPGQREDLTLPGLGLGAAFLAATLLAHPGLDRLDQAAAGLATWGWALLAAARYGRKRARAMMLLVMLLAAAGFIFLLQLAAGGGSEHWLIPFTKHAQAISVFGLAAGAALLPWARRTVGWLADSPKADLFRLMLAAGGTALIVLHALAGGSFGGIQTSEAAKALSIVILAYAAARLGRYARYNAVSTRWWRAVAAALALAAFALAACISAMILDDDNSPALLLAMLGLFWVILLAVIIRAQVGIGRFASPALAIPLVLATLVFTAVGMATFLLATVPWPRPEFAVGKIEQRIEAFLEPTAARHASAQIAAAWSVITKAEAMPDMAEAFRPNLEEAAVPEIERDLPLAFVLRRFGIGTAALLLAAQVLLVATMSAIAWSCLHRLDVGEMPGRLFVGAGTALAAVLFGLQALIGWSNVVNLAPLMGQPTPLLSAGNSNLLLVSLPAAMFALIAASYG